MELTPMHKRVIALDVHQSKITACALIEQEDGSVEADKREFGAFKRDRRALAQWALEVGPELDFIHLKVQTHGPRLIERWG